jgi:hypothetical protein
MDDNKLLKYIGYFFSGLFFTGVFVFFAFFYNHHLHFKEQSQLFLLTRDFFISSISLPGGLSGYIGSFLTQFYISSPAGSLIITLLLLAIYFVTSRILSLINPLGSVFPLSLIPSLFSALILCNEFYPLSAVVGFLIGLLAILAYVRLKKPGQRFIGGIILILLTYWFAGGSFLMLFFLMVTYEILVFFRNRKERGKSKDISNESIRSLKIWQTTIFLILVAGIPMLVRQFLILQPAGLSFISEFYYDLRTVFPKTVAFIFLIPAILILLLSIVPSKKKIYQYFFYSQIVVLILTGYFGLKYWANFSAEEIMTYDYLVRNERWNDVIKFAAKKPPRNNLSLAMLNLSLAKTGKMGDRLFFYEQNGDDGLFLPFAKEYVAPMMGSEIFFNLGLINASQEYSFESMETTPTLKKSVRSIKRLAETNLINGQYEVSRKYLKILENTIFYRKWAKDTEKYLYNEDMINKHPVWGKLRSMMVSKDFFFKVENMESNLNMLLLTNPLNEMAFQYLMAFYLINKDLRNFAKTLSYMDQIKYSTIPVSYQEAIMYLIGLTSRNPMQNIPFDISEDTKAKMKAYAAIYTTNRNAQELLRKRFSHTYWYYLHYKKIEINSEAQKP